MLALAGCAARPVAETVRLPVFAPCIAAVPVKPDYEFGKLAMAAPDGEKILALARDWPRARWYEGQLEAALAGCR
ncbi:hypothetical protein GJA_1451 [Janthinobacterium agaricidamnosum NBRC 102515 = DSM 9628]|uniref:Uncharacterized protein n=2 Tax=Janthinobacterium agaricidamnosum TaxID=55508 RepID=W0V4B1_9BURK|nr:hypothetical protein GJA_1451 [Janthinobacterium agaricidamnosum NBRC 102515 = DSM 9628]